MLLSKRDLSRLPANFEKEVCNTANAEITIKKTPANIKNGFILVYGDIEIDCTFDAIFDTYRDELRDIVHEQLF